MLPRRKAEAPGQALLASEDHGASAHRFAVRATGETTASPPQNTPGTAVPELGRVPRASPLSRSRARQELGDCTAQLQPWEVAHTSPGVEELTTLCTVWSRAGYGLSPSGMRSLGEEAATGALGKTPGLNPSEPSVRHSLSHPQLGRGRLLRSPF